MWKRAETEEAAEPGGGEVGKRGVGGYTTEAPSWRKEEKYKSKRYIIVENKFAPASKVSINGEKEEEQPAKCTHTHTNADTHTHAHVRANMKDKASARRASSKDHEEMREQGSTYHTHR